MSKTLTPLQTGILLLAETRNLDKMTYREIASYLGDVHPYSVQIAINKLVHMGLLVKNRNTGSVVAMRMNNQLGKKPFLNIPILGKVSCGPALEIAEETASGYITVSPSAASIRRPEMTYALIAVGDSMCTASINGKSVDDGDYVIVQKATWGSAVEGDYVISRYNDLNSLKKLHIDRENHRVVLFSESRDEQPPIIIDERDMEYYAIEGVAVDVVKGVNL